MSKLFISYSSKDKDRIAPLVEALEERGHEVWWDKKIGGATRFSTEIEAALDGADAAIVAWSQNAVTSEWVLDEAAHARDYGKIVPIRLDDVFPPLGFRQRQAIDFSQWAGSPDDPAMDELDAALGRVNSGTIGEYEAESRTIIHEHKSALSHRQIVALVAAFLIASVAAIYVWQDYRGEVAARELKGSPNENVVAILPFKGAGDDGSNERLIARVYEGLVTKLSKVDGLTILSPLALTRYSGELPPLDEISSATGARYVMLGNVEEISGEMRLSLQLADAALGTNVWTTDIARLFSMEGLHEVQVEIAGTVARQLKAALDDGERERISQMPTRNREAYDDYLIGVGMLESDPDPTRYINSRIEALERAVEADPEFAEAYAALSVVHMMQMRTAQTASARERESMRITIERALEQARFLDPDSAETLIADGFYHLWVTNNFAMAETTLERAVRLAPSVQVAAFGYGWAARRNGRFDQSLAALERAVILDPFAYQPIRDLSWSLAAAGRSDDAWVYYEKARPLAPGPSANASHEARLHLIEGDPEAALESFAGIGAGPDGLSHMILTEAAIDAGDREAIAAAMDAWPTPMRAPGGIGTFYLVRQAEVAERFGDEDRLAALRRQLAAAQRPLGPGQRAPWGMPLAPVTIPSFLGESEEVERLVAEYDKRQDIDQWLSLIVDRRTIAEAFARLGEHGRALDQLAMITDGLGPAAFHSFSYEPLFEPLQADARWRAMRNAARDASHDDA